MPNRHACKLLLPLAVLLGSLPLPAQVSEKDLDIAADKKTTLKATYYDPGRPGPGILLLHQCNSDRKSWKGLARKLSAAGVHVLTFDYRGYGESDGADAPTPQRRKMRRKWGMDTDRAYEFLRAQKGVDQERMGAGGASCGVHQAAQLSLRHPEVKTLVLLSGGTNDEGLIHIRDTAELSVFGSASEEDERAAKSIKRIIKLSKNENSKLVMNNYAGHGVPMFRAEPELLPMIAEWFVQRLSQSEEGDEESE